MDRRKGTSKGSTRGIDARDGPPKGTSKGSTQRIVASHHRRKASMQGIDARDRCKGSPTRTVSRGCGARERDRARHRSACAERRATDRLWIRTTATPSVVASAPRRRARNAPPPRSKPFAPLQTGCPFWTVHRRPPSTVLCPSNQRARRAPSPPIIARSFRASPSITERSSNDRSIERSSNDRSYLEVGDLLALDGGEPFGLLLREADEPARRAAAALVAARERRAAAVVEAELGELALDLGNAPRVARSGFDQDPHEIRYRAVRSGSIEIQTNEKESPHFGTHAPQFGLPHRPSSSLIIVRWTEGPERHRHHHRHHHHHSIIPSGLLSGE